MTTGGMTGGVVTGGTAAPRWARMYWRIQATELRPGATSTVLDIRCCGVGPPMMLVMLPIEAGEPGAAGGASQTLSPGLQNSKVVELFAPNPVTRAGSGPARVIAPIWVP